jgi:hypothetical protein
MAGFGHLEYLRGLGFQTFASLIDEDYDKETNLSKRMQMISEVLVHLSSKPDGFLDLYHQSQHIREHNFNHLFYLMGRQDLDYSISLRNFIIQCKIQTTMTPDVSWQTTKSDFYKHMVTNQSCPWLAVDSGKDHYLDKE